MTSIKPPGPSIATPPDMSGASEAADNAGSAGALGTGRSEGGSAFREVLGQATQNEAHSEAQKAAQTHSFATQNAAISAVSGAGAADPISVLSQQIKSGQISVEQAVDALVERAAAGVGKHLGAGERAELTDLLRHALGSDATLAALRDGMR